MVSGEQRTASSEQRVVGLEVRAPEERGPDGAEVDEEADVAHAWV